MDTTLYSYVESGDTTEFNFTEAKPYYQYVITVSAATSRGYGAESDESVISTAQAQPDPPTALSTTYEEYDLTNYNVIATINWNVPCEVNGILSHFKLVIEGNSTYTNETERFEREVLNVGEFSVSAEHSLQAAYNYIFSIINVLENDLESENSEITLLAPDGCKYLLSERRT